MNDEQRGGIAIAVVACLVIGFRFGYSKGRRDLIQGLERAQRIIQLMNQEN